MRTKTLALSALLGMIGTASVMSQSVVYSLNAVGYITVSLAPGFNILSCQLITTNNTLGNLLNDSSGVYDGCQTYKYHPATGTYSTDVGDSQGSSYANGWDNGGTDTMNPGEALWFDNDTGSTVTVTFVGTVPQGTNAVNLSTGFNLIASPVPFSGDVVTNMGFTNYVDGSQVYVFNTTTMPAVGNNPSPGNYTTSIVDIQGGSEGYMSQWDTPDPVAYVGQGFWVYSPGATSWAQVFSVNP